MSSDKLASVILFSMLVRIHHPHGMQQPESVCPGVILSSHTSPADYHTCSVLLLLCCREGGTLKWQEAKEK